MTLFIIGGLTGFIVCAILAAGKITDLQRQINSHNCDKRRLCAECNHALEIKGLREAYSTERKRTAAWKGEANTMQRKLWNALNENEKLKEITHNGYALVGG